MKTPKCHGSPRSDAERRRALRSALIGVAALLRWLLLTIVLAIVLLRRGLLSRCLLGIATLRRTAALVVTAAAIEHLHVVTDDFGRVALDAFFVFVAAGLDATLHVDLAALGEIVVAVFGGLAPDDDPVPLGLFDPVVVLVHVCPRGGHAELADGAAPLGVAKLGVAPEVADDDCFVDTGHVVNS